jgi:hypothetical protein
VDIIFLIMAKVKIQKIPYGGWKNCVQITNDLVDLIVTTDIGPRIIRYGFIGQANEFCEIVSQKGLTGGDQWRIYGGHRLWHSPEDKKRTYEPDNGPVIWEEFEDGIITKQNIELYTGIQKEMEISLDPENTSVKILHRLTNRGLLPAELSVWSISAMATSGKEIIPLTQRNTGLLPNRLIVLWPYTELNDPRMHFGKKHIALQQDPCIEQPLKIGISNENGWGAYFNHNHLFVKYYTHHMQARYPDFGVSYETYANDFMLEMETLSPLIMIEPNSLAEHIEKWELFDNVPMPTNDETEIDLLLKIGIRM